MQQRSKTVLSPGPALFMLSACLTLSVAASADDWPQWRGPARSGTASDFEPPSSWPETLKQGWRVEVGQADSSPLVADGKVIVFSRIGGSDDSQESLSAFDLATGELVWRKSYEAPFKPLTIVGEHGAGPYSTPLVADGRVFTVGIAGHLTAWNLADGAQLWQRTFDDQFKKTYPFYGAAQSPLQADGKLVVHVGGPGQGALSAFDPATGKDLWRYETDGPAYGSGVVTEIEGITQIVTFTQRSLSGIALDSGKLLWTLPYQVSFDGTHLTPVIIDGKVLVSADKTPLRAYAPKVTKRKRNGDTEWQVDTAWENDQVWMGYSSPVVNAGRLFAFASQKKGQLVEVDPASGEVLWSSEPRTGENAWLISAANLIMLVSVDGDLQVFEPQEQGARKIASYQVADSSVWAHPALVTEGLLIKDKGHLTLWRLNP